ncbi:MAG: hypothetical protein HYS25_10030 [Ignavibacteriales bacterium]|nr:hypothetical protein [Ignavibacteriales bacterium]
MRRNNSSIWVGLILIAIGALLVFHNYNFFYFDVSDFIFSWHTLLLIIGIIILSKSKNSAVGIIFLIIGLLGSANHFFPFVWDFAFGDLWPIFLILIGLFVLLRRKEMPVHKTETEHEHKDCFHDTQPTGVYNDTIDESILFTAVHKVVTSDKFRGGKISLLIGGAKIDLTKSKLAEGENILDINCIFGGCTIIVPGEWKIIANVNAVFGGVDDKRYINPSVVSDDGSILLIRGSVIFGGIEIRNY